MADAPNQQSLGVINAILQFCSSVDRHDADLFQKVWMNIAGTKTELDDYKGDALFKQAYDSTRDLLAKVPQGQAASTCALGFTSPKQDLQSTPHKPASNKRS